MCFWPGHDFKILTGRQNKPTYGKKKGHRNTQGFSSMKPRVPDGSPRPHDVDMWTCQLEVGLRSPIGYIYIIP